MENKINKPIERSHTGKGKPAVITHSSYGQLTNRQQKLLDNLPDYDDNITVPKNKVCMRDLSALTAKTGVEFALFTKGNERLVIRGNQTSVNISSEKAKELAKQGYTWSGHTHPGVDISVCTPSAGDLKILKAFGQSQTVIYNSVGEWQKIGSRME